jgi:hypothetical protein
MVRRTVTDNIADRDVTYQCYAVPEMDTNPLISALNPPTDSLDQQLERLKLKPDFAESERNLPSSVRTFLLNRLEQNFFFPSTQHVKIYKDIEAQVIGGYWSRNPMSPGGQRLVHNAGTPGPHIERTIIGDPGVAATVSFLTGLSGIGKTALMKRIAAALGKSVIAHSNFRGKPFTDTQIVVLMRNCSDQPNYTTKAIAKLLADRVDELLNVSLYGHVFRNKVMTRTDYVAELRKILTNNWVGIVIIDVFEHLSLAGTSGRDELIAMLVNLRDELGVPIILVGTYKAAEILNAASASVTRRFVDGGFHDLKRPESSSDEDFTSFCDVCWSYQWVKSPIALSDEIRETLYDLSQGITAVFLMLFRFSQIEAIWSESEHVDAKMLRDTYHKRLSPLHGILNALRSREKTLLDKYDDLYLRAFNEVEFAGVTNRLSTMLEQMKQRAQSPGLPTPETRALVQENEGRTMSAEQRTAEVMGCATSLPVKLS